MGPRGRAWGRAGAQARGNPQMRKSVNPRGCASAPAVLCAGAHVRAALIVVLLAEAELELVPPALHRAPSVVTRGKKRRRAPEHLLLDQAQDHKAMRALPEGNRRGRPDIVHLCLLLLLDSPLAHRGELVARVHTRNDELIEVRPDARLPRSQAKFYQLCEDLMRQGRVPLEEPLLALRRGVSLDAALAECPAPRILLDEAGVPMAASGFAQLARERSDLTIVLGAFPRGAWRQARPETFDVVARTAAAPVSAWSALVPALAGLQEGRP